jgi:predicted ABC-type ATPase
MSVIYIIAGPPGIGKSTRGHEFIDEELDILNEDEMRFRYKASGYADYNEYSIQRVKNIIRQNLINNQDFALELNLGFPHQYDYVLSAKRFRHENKLNIILFFTDDIGLCLRRAKERHEHGLHLVKPEIIREMYVNTILMLKNNFADVDHLVLLHTSDDNRLFRIAEYNKEDRSLKIFNNSADWFNNDLKPFIESRI